ncbi:hypothetical protein B0F90DRAFT_1926581 [Multifurca ochricompacta]|uniref:F-box domain-containing protein n=1 Tax=Multifurca ochricompacta TaxID=376703 RepID=A0AAD4M3J2_9AGAM|nr:hypothetical protein B0F90DRAFT_1926581 [Multifurca ochricompacta]
MTIIPPELIAEIISEVHTPSDLLQLRLVNSMMNTLATPLAFQSIRVINKDRSVNRFRRIAAHKKFAQLVHQVIYQYEEADPSDPIGPHTLRGLDPTSFVEALLLLSQLPALDSLILKFRVNDDPFKIDDNANPDDMTFPPEVVLQFLIFRALAENEQGLPSPLKSLVVDNLLPLPHPYLGSPTILGLLSTLTHLTINTTAHCAAFPMINPQLPWPPSYHLFQKEALSSSLVSLQLHHVHVRSADMLIPISEVHLPRLAHLSLQKIYFSGQGEVENFIARHGRTLIGLKLFVCPLALTTEENSVRRPTRFRRWSQVWERLNNELKVLKELTVSERLDSNGIEDAGSMGWYVHDCYRCKAVSLSKADTTEDDTVLKRFKDVVASRSG